MDLPNKYEVTQYSEEYDRISTKFSNSSRTNKHDLVLTKIERIENPTLKSAFEHQELIYKIRYGSVEIHQLFHGTKKINIPSILKNNLDPQRHGKSTGHRFGAGVSFSAMSSYASHYCDEGGVGQMLLCDVVISNIVEVPENKNNLSPLLEPPYLPGGSGLRYDTTAKNKTTKDVIVKYNPNEFYPSYIISFKRMKRGDCDLFMFQDAMARLLKGYSLNI